MKNEIIYITPVIMPSSSAAAKRILGNVKMFRNNGYKVRVFSGGNFKNEKYNYEGIDVYSCGYGIENSNGLKKLLAYRKTVLKISKRLDKLDLTKIKCVIIYSGYSVYLFYLNEWAKKNKINILFDAVEWYAPKSKIEWLYNAYYWDIEFSMRILLPKLNGIICISTFLNSYYVEKGCKTYLIPPLFTSKYPIPNDKNIKPLRISYSGIPGKKDELDKVFTALSEINKGALKIVFDVVGLDEAEILNLSYFKQNDIFYLPPYVNAYGFVERKIAERISRNSNFSILFRKSTRTNNAGFSTKMVESLSLGVPLICNLTSDMSLYLENNYNAIIVEELHQNQVTKSFIKATELSQYDLNKMAFNAFNTAQKHFYFKNFNLSQIKF